ncbi:phosphoketolase family protein [Streptomyces avermitilis]
MRFYSDGHSIAHLRRALADALDAATPLGTPGPGSVLVLTLDKGHGAPGRVAGRPIAGTPAVHKTPLPRPAQRPEEFTALERWLTSYQPERLMTPDGRPRPPLLPALPTAPRQHPALEPPHGCIAASTTSPKPRRTAPSRRPSRRCSEPAPARARSACSAPTNSPPTGFT